MSFKPCWYWMPITSQPNSLAIRTAAIYILHCSSTCSRGQIGGRILAKDKLQDP